MRLLICWGCVNFLVGDTIQRSTLYAALMWEILCLGYRRGDLLIDGCTTWICVILGQ